MEREIEETVNTLVGDITGIEKTAIVFEAYPHRQEELYNALQNIGITVIPRYSDEKSRYLYDNRISSFRFLTSEEEINSKILEENTEIITNVIRRLADTLKIAIFANDVWPSKKYTWTQLLKTLQKIPDIKSILDKTQMYGNISICMNYDKEAENLIKLGIKEKNIIYHNGWSIKPELIEIIKTDQEQPTP